MTKPGDVDDFTRVRCYEAIANEYLGQITVLSLSPDRAAYKLLLKLEAMGLIRV